MSKVSLLDEAQSKILPGTRPGPGVFVRDSPSEASDGVLAHDWDRRRVSSSYERWTCKNCEISITIHPDAYPINLKDGSLSCAYLIAKMVMES